MHGLTITPRLMCFMIVLLPMIVMQDLTAEDESPTRGTPRKELKLPGLVINFEKRFVDVASVVCLTEGTLELIACTKGTKEHESIIAIEAKAMHVHTGLLLLGSRPGHPAIRRRVDSEGGGWIDLPPRGDPVDVYLVVPTSDDTAVEYPISDFVEPNSDLDLPGGTGPGTDGDGVSTKPANKLPHSFLFAGSVLVEQEDGPRRYLSDANGNVISIATFGDELLCLPELHSQENRSLLWRVNDTHLPTVGTKVTLRLRPRPSQTDSDQSDDPDVQD